ncbi:hypothetical protein DFH06DRAFT_1164823 [Mycena polygramma]|nr:hypothetical protein DFH06DRAFT_1164823 [Mycena polygramma]
MPPSGAAPYPRSQRAEHQIIAAIANWALQGWHKSRVCAPLYRYRLSSPNSRPRLTTLSITPTLFASWVLLSLRFSTLRWAKSACLDISLYPLCLLGDCGGFDSLRSGQPLTKFSYRRNTAVSIVVARLQFSSAYRPQKKSGRGYPAMYFLCRFHHLHLCDMSSLRLSTPHLTGSWCTPTEVNPILRCVAKYAL